MAFDEVLAQPEVFGAVLWKALAAFVWASAATQLGAAYLDHLAVVAADGHVLMQREHDFDVGINLLDDADEL